MNASDYLVLLLVGCGVVFAARLARKRKNAGCGGCCASCGCACPRRSKEP